MSKKPSIRKYIKDLFIRGMKDDFPDFTLSKSKPSIARVGSCVFVKEATSYLTLFVDLYIHPNKNRFYLYGLWSPGEYPDIIGQRGTATSLKKMQELGYSPDFEQEAYGTDVGKLKWEGLGYISRPWKFPGIYSEEEYAAALPIVTPLVEEALSDVENYLLPYFELLIEFKKARQPEKTSGA